MAIAWEHIGQQKFDRIVEVLVHRLYDASADVVPVDGRGGDGGIDIKVTTGARVRIFQLKYYPDGFPSSSFKSRQKSIKKSFERAMKHSPYEWVLVVPCNLSPPEQDFVDGLAGKRSVRVRVMGRAELDERLATHRDLEAYFAREPLIEAAKILNHEQTVLAGGTQDLAARVTALGGQVDQLDPHWTVDFARQGNAVVHSLRAKHPRAHVVSPVSVTVTRRSGLPTDLEAAISRAWGFGLAEDVVLPPEAVESLTVIGPEWLSHTISDVEVEWQPLGPAPYAGAAAEVFFLDEAGSVAASCSGRLNGLGRGHIGRSIDVELTGGTLQLLLPNDSATSARVHFTFRLGEVEPAAALRLVGLQQRLLAGGGFEVRAEGATVSSGDLLPPPAAEQEQDQAEQIRLYVDDLRVLQQHCEQHFPVPGDLSARDRVALRRARLLIEGHCVVSRYPSMTFTLDGGDSPSLRRALTGGPCAMRLGTKEFTFSLGGRTFDLGPTWMYHPRAVVVDGDRAVAALDAGQAKDLPVEVRPADGEHFWLYLDSAPRDRPLVPVPFALPGYPEPR